MKINTVVAKALAEKVVTQLRELRKESEAKSKADILDIATNLPSAIAYNKAIENAEILFNQAKQELIDTGRKNYSLNSFSKSTFEGKLSFYNHENIIAIPAVDDIKNNIILGDAAGEGFNAETFIADLVSQYKSKLGL